MRDKRVNELAREIQTWDGWRLQDIGDAYVAYPPDRSLGGVNFHKGPSDHAWLIATLARLRRAGAPVLRPGRPKHG
jgi:hypothetical protein